MFEIAPPELATRLAETASDVGMPLQLPREEPEQEFDFLLQASRRVDWRFLLPQPKLAGVAYVGPQSGSLVPALQCFSDSLTLIAESGAQPVSSDLYPLVVVQGCEAELLTQAAKLVCPNGFLYLEVGGASPGRLKAWASRLFCQRNDLLRPHGSAAFLEELGFQVQSHWHWPDFESCREIVPLSNQALSYVFGRRGGGLSGSGKFLLMQILWRSKLWVHVVRCFSVLGQRL